MRTQQLAEPSKYAATCRARTNCNLLPVGVLSDLPPTHLLSQTARENDSKYLKISIKNKGTENEKVQSMSKTSNLDTSIQNINVEWDTVEQNISYIKLQLVIYFVLGAYRVPKAQYHLQLFVIIFTAYSFRILEEK